MGELNEMDEAAARGLRIERREFAAALVDLSNQALRLGLWRTVRSFQEVEQAYGRDMKAGRGRDDE